MKSPLGARLAFLLVSGAALAACGGGDDDDASGLGKGSGGAGGKGSISVGGSSPIPTSGGSSGTNGSTGGSGAGDSGGSGPYMLPEGFERADDGGGWKLGDPVVEGEDPPDFGISGMEGCGQQILGVVRDFKRGDKGGHADFNTFQGQGEKGAVKPTLGDDQKPVFEPNVLDDTDKCTADADGSQGSCFTNEDNFNEWYVNDPELNSAHYIFFSLEPRNGKATFHSNAFFPLDGEGFGNEGDEHNFSFTTEVHTTFKYSGGERFSFNGDDDLWVYINGHLAIDLGGLHSRQNAEAVLDDHADDWGLEQGEVYPLDLFHAERHTNESNFSIDSTLYFVDCGVIVPSEPVK